MIHASPERLAQYLDVMGIQRWIRRSLPPTPSAATEETPVAQAVSASPISEAVMTHQVITNKITSETVSETVSTHAETDADSPPPWLSEAPPPDEAYTVAFTSAPAFVPTTIPETVTEPEPLAPPLTQVLAALNWGALMQHAQQCAECSLHQARQRVLFGEGDMTAHWLFIGDAPDADEDTRGYIFPELPLSSLFNEILRAVQLNRKQVYFTNIVKCYPPKGREASATEQQTCCAYLARQIELLQPRIIVTLGSVASQQLLQTTQNISELRGQIQYYGATHIPVVPTFHPKYLLHRPIEKRKVWQDLQRAWHYSQQNAPSAFLGTS